MSKTKSIRSVLAVAAVVVTAACSSPQDKAYAAQEDSFKAEARMKEERLKLLDQYKSCANKNEGNEDEACGYLLRAIESTQ